MLLTDKVVAIFTEINQIPRGSGNEIAISNWLINLGKKFHWETYQDAYHNVILRVPGKKDLSHAEVVIIQGHMDMVCVREDGVEHDFLNDPISVIEAEGWLHADGTTLGADNGIALAIGLALAMEDGISHPPLELLFTSDEERGLIGAKSLSPGLLRGRFLINLDSDREGVFTVGCAGGKATHIKLPVAFEKNTDKSSCQSYEISISKLSGGHSGVQIHERKPNAIHLLSRVLSELSKTPLIYMLDGGTAHNIIPTHASVRFCYRDESEVKAVCQNIFATFEKEYDDTETQMLLTWKKVEPADSYITAELSEKIVWLLMSLPHGVFSMSADVEHLVETSNNLAQVSISDDNLTVLLSQRSSLDSQNHFITKKIEAIARLVGAEVYSGAGYPAWEPNWKSPLLKKAILVYEDLFQQEPVIEIIHAGVECGVLSEKYPDIQMLSLGPTIKNAHTYHEKVNVSDIEKILDFLLALFLEISKIKKT
jgi:dipeptidase D